MNIRDVSKEDRHYIEYLNNLQTDFKLSTLNNCVIDKLVFDGNVPVAYGIVKRMAEAIMLVNTNCPKLMRAEAMRELMKYAEMGARREGLEQLHLFVKDPTLVKSLIKHFGYEQTQDIVLVKNL